jgi:hypothetical protein
MTSIAMNQQETELQARKRAARRTALIVGAVAVAIFVLSIVQMLNV